MENNTVKGNGTAGPLATAGNNIGVADAETLIRTIRTSQDSGVLKSTIIRIVELRDPRFVGPLTEMLKSSNINARRLSAWALGIFGDPKTRDALKAALADPDASVKNLAADALKRMEARAPVPSPVQTPAAAPAPEKKIESKAPVPSPVQAPVAVPAPEKKHSTGHLETALTALSEDVDAFNRQAAARALGEINDPRAMEGLLSATNDNDPIVRSAAFLALVSFKKDPRIYPVLLNGMKDDDFATRGEAALALGRIQDDRAFDPLLNALRNGRPELREKAATALGEMGDLRAVDGLRGSMARDEKIEVRKSAEKALTIMAHHVSKGLKDPDPDVREMTADHLGKIQDPYPVPALIETLCDEVSVVRESAANALGIIGDRSATQPIIKLLKDKRGYVRKHAAHALGVLKDPQAVDALILTTRDEQWFVRVEAAWALGQISSDKALKVLMAMFNDQDRNVRQAAVEAVQQYKNCKVSFKPLPRRE
ncbi:MAG: HEAT repeat domain-containing protein [Methanocella sp.]